MAKVGSREWQKFRLGLVHRGIIGSTGWSEAADNYIDRDGSARGGDFPPRIEDLEGTLLRLRLLSYSSFRFPFPFSRACSRPSLGATFFVHPGNYPP